MRLALRFAVFILAPILLTFLLLPKAPRPPAPLSAPQGEAVPRLARSRLGSLKIWPGAMRAIAFSGNGRLLAYAGDDGRIRLAADPFLCEARSWRADQKIDSLVFSPDGRWLVSLAEGEQTARLWDLTAVGWQGKTFEGVSAAVFLPDNRTLVLGGARLKFYDAIADRDKHLDPKIALPSAIRVRDLAVDSSGELLALAATRPLDHDSPMFSIVTLADGVRKDIVIADTSPPGPRFSRHRWTSGDESAPSPRVSFFRGGNSVFLSVQATMYRFDRDTGTTTPIQPEVDDGLFRFSSSSPNIARPGRVRIHPRTMAIAWLEPGASTVTCTPLDAKIDPNDDDDSRPDLRLNGHSFAVNDFAYSPDGQLLATASRDGTVVVWEVGRPNALELTRDPGAVNWTRAGGGGTIPVPEDLTVELSFRKTFSVTEDIYADIKIQNVGRSLLSLDHDAVHLSAVHEDGTPVHSPHDYQSMWMGGGLRAGPTELIAGLSTSYSTYINQRFEFLKPGRYIVEARLAGEKPKATATLVITFPDEKEAREFIVKKATSKSLNGSLMTAPCFLPPLVEVARRGDTNAVWSIHWIHTPEATDELLKLATSDRPDVADTALAALEKRIPDSETPRRPHAFGLYDYARKNLAHDTWRPRHAEELRRLTSKRIAADDFLTGTLDQVRRVAWCAAQLGDPQDRDLLLGALDREVQRTDTEPLPSLQPLCWAIQTMFANGLDLPAAPKAAPRGDGETIAFCQCVHADKSFRPPGWAEWFASGLDLTNPHARKYVVLCVPETVPDTVRERLPRLFDDPDPKIVAAACWIAESANDRRMTPRLLELVRTTGNTSVWSAAFSASCKLGARREALLAAADRLETLETTVLSTLAGELGDKDSKYGTRPKAELGDRATLHARWKRFLADNADAIDGGQRFSFADLPAAAELFPTYQFQRKNQADRRRDASGDWSPPGSIDPWRR